MENLNDMINNLPLRSQLKVAIKYTKDQWPNPNDSEQALITVLENALKPLNNVVEDGQIFPCAHVQTCEYIGQMCNSDECDEFKSAT